MMTLNTDVWKTSTRDFEPAIQALENKIKVGWAVIQEMETQIVKAACQDSGVKLGQQIVFPLLNKRVESEAHKLDIDRAADTADIMKVTEPSPLLHNACLMDSIWQIIRNRTKEVLHFQLVVAFCIATTV